MATKIRPVWETSGKKTIEKQTTQQLNINFEERMKKLPKTDWPKACQTKRYHQFEVLTKKSSKESIEKKIENLSNEIHR